MSSKNKRISRSQGRININNELSVLILIPSQSKSVSFGVILNPGVIPHQLYGFETVIYHSMPHLLHL